MHSAQSRFGRAKPRLLVVDDDPSFCLLMKETLETSGWVVRSARDGLEGYDLFSREHFDVVLLDVVMPKLDGFSTCRSIRETAQGGDVPVLIITGLNDLQSIENAYHAGATDFLTKPINWALLPHRLKYILRATRAFTALRKNESQLNVAQQIAQVGSWEWDPQSDSVEFSAETGRILGIDTTERIVGYRNLFANVQAEDYEQLIRKFSDAQLTRKAFSIEFHVAFESGRAHAVFLRAEWVRDGRHGEETLAGTVQDITSQREAADQIRRLAYYDPLTGLANRTLFKERLAEAIAGCASARHSCGVLFIDVDNFKFINDTHGHDAGDSILFQLSRRLQQLVEKWSDAHEIPSGGATPLVARIGGDEFTVLLPRIDSRRSVSALAKALRDACREVFQLSSAETALSVSIGISFHPTDGYSFGELLKAADLAMYHAKRMGKNNYQFYDPSINRHGKRQVTIESELRKAFENGDLELHYQPRVNIVSGAISGVEALLRWNSERLGIVPPAEFIPIAEATGLIVPVGEWVLETAFQQAQTWVRDGDDHPVRLAVNISACQFKHPTFLHIVKRALRGFDRTDLLELEITETVLLEDSEFTRSTMAAIKTMGFRIVVDDFGAGYASLNYLKRLPIDGLKIDKSFIEGLPDRASDSAITSAIIALTRNLNLDVVAEGVENAEQLYFLKERRCGEVQGYLFSHAVRAPLVDQMLTAQRLTMPRFRQWAQDSARDSSVQ